MKNFPPFVEDKGIQGLLDWAAGQCDKRKAYCERIETIGRTGSANSKSVAELIDWLRSQIERHFRYESEFLFPALLGRAEEEDDFKLVTTVLKENQKDSLRQISSLLPRLQAYAASGGRVDAELAGDLLDLATRERRHIALFSKIVLPIARVRLTDGDFNRLKEGVWAEA